MNKIWVVGVSNPETNRIVAICATKEIAERELFKARDELIEEWRDMDIFCNKDGRKDDIYKKMIKALTGDNYKKWDNFPHDCPYLYETELLED